jgi:hypothetical protein
VLVAAIGTVALLLGAVMIMGAAAASGQATSARFEAVDDALYNTRVAMTEKGVTVDVADVDGDGDLDAFVGNIADCQGCNAANRVWINDGDGNFDDSLQRLGHRDTWGVALGDFDGDGDPDVFSANAAGAAAEAASNTVWLNTSGSFADSGQRLGSADSRHVAVGDLDGDGDLDAFVANMGANTVWLNDGSGTFADSGLRLGDKRTLVVALGDLDGDGDLDAMTGNTGLNHVWWNESTPGHALFVDSGMLLGEAHSGGDGPATKDIALGDLDGDGDLDAFVVNAGVGTRDGKPAEVLNTVYLAEGDPNAPGRTIFVDSGQRLGDDFSFGVDLADVDGDGDLDAFVANSYLCGTANKVWLNDGKGVFSDSGQRLGVGNGYDVRFGDFDGDTDPDAFLVNYGPAPDSLCRTEEGEPAETWINDGVHSGTFSERFGERYPGLHSTSRRSTGAALGDVDGDGDIDVFVTNRGDEDPRLGDTDPATSAPDLVWLNDGSGHLSDSGQALGPLDSRGVALGDLDGDGDLDAFVTHWDTHGAPDTVWFNDGSGSYRDSGQRLGNWRSNTVKLADLDGDGDLDAFVASTAENLVWVNDGTGHFTDSGQRLGEPHPGGLGPNSEDVGLADLDGDGDIDAFVANSGVSPGENPNTVWLNDGSGRFVSNGQRMGNEYSFGVALTDYDYDGDVDAFVANSSVCGAANELWLNDGSGHFVDSGQRLGLNNSMSVAAGDFDCDGDTDVVVGNVSVAKVEGYTCPADCPIQRGNRVWLNDGHGVFVEEPEAIGNSSTVDIEAGDLDGNGSDDIYAANGGRCGLFNRVWLSLCSPQQPTATPPPATVTVVPPSATPVPPTDTPGPPPSATLVPPTDTPGAPTAPAPTDTPVGPPTATVDPAQVCVCPIVPVMVPASVIDDARRNPHKYEGWNELVDPGKPESPLNRRRTCLGILNVNRPYHPVWNPVVWRASCHGNGCVFP